MTNTRQGDQPGEPPRGLDPLAEPERCLTWLERYLLPRPLGGAGHRAHQFTINGLTYPFVRHYNFAAVPDPPSDRRYDMYSGLHLALPGDLLFFFQADPQAPGGDINSRRGLRGVYRVRGHPYRATGPVRDTTSGIGYQILDKCPGCGSPHATFAAECPHRECGGPYPPVQIGGQPIATRVLSSHLGIEPLFAFERSVSDERMYADMSDPGIIWVGRHDNAMGPGKGSSIRHLLPEETIKLVRLLLREPGQAIGAPTPHAQPAGRPLAHRTGQPIDELPTDPSGRVSREDELYYLITRQLFTANSAFRHALQPHLPTGITWDHLEYASSTFPWGYTAGTADFVIILRDRAGRRLIIVIECKTGRVHDEAVLQVLLYAERVLQVAFLSAAPAAVPPEGQPVEILPVIIAQDARKPRHGDPRVALPLPYTLRRSYFGGATVNARVRSPLFLRYVALPAPRAAPNIFRPVGGFMFQPLAAWRSAAITWTPEAGAVGTTVEMGWTLSHSWAAARAAAGL